MDKCCGTCKWAGDDTRGFSDDVEKLVWCEFPIDRLPTFAAEAIEDGYGVRLMSNVDGETCPTWEPKEKA